MPYCKDREVNALKQKKTKKTLLYITTSLPSLTLTFVYREIFALRDLDYNIKTVSMNRPSISNVSKESSGLLSTTTFLDGTYFWENIAAFLQVSLLEPGALLKCIFQLIVSRPIHSLRDYFRLGYHLLEACYLFKTLKHESIEHIHCHFISGPTSLGLFLSTLLDIPFSFTMHASLIWKDPIALTNKLNKCKFCVSISDYNKQFVLKTYGTHFRDKIHVVHCGIPPSTPSEYNREKNHAGILKILGVGQLTERKGFLVLIKACHILKLNKINFECTIVGEGDQREQLESLIKRLELSNNVILAGAKSQEELPAYLSSTDIFVLPCVIAKDGLRDGIPVSLMEAMLQKIPVISTDILGLPELIDSGVNGLLVEPEDATALANSIKHLEESTETRLRLGEEAAMKVLTSFNSEHSARQLDKLFCT